MTFLLPFPSLPSLGRSDPSGQPTGPSVGSNQSLGRPALGTEGRFMEAVSNLTIAAINYEILRARLCATCQERPHVAGLDICDPCAQVNAEPVDRP